MNSELLKPFRKFLRTTSLRVPEGVDAELRLDVTKPLEGLSLCCRNVGSGLTAKTGTQILALLEKWKPVRGSRFCPTDSSVRVLQKTLSELMRSAYRSYSELPAKKQTQERKSLISHALRALELLIQWARNAGSPRALCQPLGYLEQIKPYLASDLTSDVIAALPDEVNEVIADQLITAALDALASGDIELLDLVHGRSKMVESIRKLLDNSLRRVGQDRMATLPAVSQSWLLRNFETNAPTTKIEHSAPGESPEVRQAAGLLLFLWDHRQDSEPNGEAFERFRNLCEQKMHVFLGGEIGKKVPFDAQLHEKHDSSLSSTEVRLIRPWIEYRDPPYSAIVIRALVSS